MMLIDFDGTIVDLWPRYHTVFCDLTKCDISLNQYRALKQRFKKDEYLANLLKLQLPIDYFSRKAVCLEDRSHLRQDMLLLPREELLSFVEQNKSVILSRRRNTENFKWELEYLGLQDLQGKAVCVDESKLEWAIENIEGEATIIGDDVQDLQVAMLPSVNAIMVLSGLGTQEDFSSLGIAHETFQTLREYAGSRSHKTVINRSEA